MIVLMNNTPDIHKRSFYFPFPIPFYFKSKYSISI